MRKNVCKEYIRKKRTKNLLIGPAALVGGTGFFWLEWTAGVLQDIRMLPLAVPIFLFLFGSGVYLTAQGLLMLINPERSDLCTFIRAELPEAERALSGKAMLALLEQDLEKAAAFAGGTILIGEKWLFVANSSWKPVLRLEHLRNVKARRTKNGNVILKFQDQNSGGPVTRELPSFDADQIQAFLQRIAAQNP